MVTVRGYDPEELADGPWNNHKGEECCNGGSGGGNDWPYHLVDPLDCGLMPRVLQRVGGGMSSQR